MIAEQEKRKQDSIKKHVQDSLSKVRQQNGKKVIKKDDGKKNDKKTDPPKKEEPKNNRVRG